MAEHGHSVTEISIENLKSYKLPDTGKIPAEFSQARGKLNCSEIHKLTDSIWNKKELPHLSK